ncbi:MAG: CehA/McbA family metallohydrolase [Clostridia bacterium]
MQNNNEKIIIELTRFITKEEEKSYIYLPFEVPDGIERLELLYSYDGDALNSRVTRNEKNVIDMALIDESGRDVGTRGSEINYMTISPSYSTDGFDKREINKGAWTVLFGAYIVKQSGVTVNCIVTLHKKKARWLKGDTHSHTTHSDGKFSRLALGKKARAKGLDFLIYTDHNKNTEGAELPSINGLTPIRGLELTTFDGHINMWGLARPFTGSFAPKNRDDLLSKNREAHELGAVQSLCHPQCALCPWNWGFDDFIYECYEVWNAPMSKNNLLAVEFWDGMLKKGKRIAAVGGSDFHKDYIITDLLAVPTTVVYTASASPTDILEGLRTGKAVIMRSPKATMVELFVNGAMIGEETEYTQGATVTVKATDMRRSHTLRLIDSEGEFYTFTAKKRGNYSLEVPLRGKGYVRAEIKYKPGGYERLIYRIISFFMYGNKEIFAPVPRFIYTLTNPIYLT